MRILDVRLLDAAIELVGNYAPARELYREAYAFSCRWNHPVYDSMYLILARRNDAILVGIDQRMRDLAGRWAPPNSAVRPWTFESKT